MSVSPHRIVSIPIPSPFALFVFLSLLPLPLLPFLSFSALLQSKPQSVLHFLFFLFFSSLFFFLYLSSLSSHVPLIFLSFLSIYQSISTVAPFLHLLHPPIFYPPFFTRLFQLLIIVLYIGFKLFDAIVLSALNCPSVCSARQFTCFLVSFLTDSFLNSSFNCNNELYSPAISFCQSSGASNGSAYGLRPVNGTTSHDASHGRLPLPTSAI